MARNRGALLSGLQRQALLWHILTALPFVLVATALGTVLEKNGWLRFAETAVLDRFLATKSSSVAPHVAIVAITEQDHQQLFGGKSILDPATVQDIVKAVARAEPGVIGVDLGTADESYLKLPPFDVKPAIVWARTATLIPEERSLVEMLNPFGEHSDRFVPGPLFGRQESDEKVLSGLALAPVDSDRSIRHYIREFDVLKADTTGTEDVRMDSFHWAVTREYCRLTGDQECQEVLQKTDHHHDLILNVTIDPYKILKPIPARRLLGDSIDSVWRDDDGTLRPPLKELLRGKIVLLGGMYQAACDEHNTAVGIQYGVELIAEAIESEFRGGDIRPVGEGRLISLDIASGVLFVVLTYYCSRGWKRIIRIGAIPIIAVFGSLIAFHSYAIWANFVPILLGVYFHYRYEQSKEHAELRKELEELRTTNHELKEKLSELEENA